MEVWIKQDLLPFVAMVAVIVGQVSVMEAMKIAMNNGVDKYVMIVYSNSLASLLYLLCCLIKHRLNWPPINFSLVCKFCFLSLCGILMVVFSYVGIEFSSPVLASAMSNIIPGLTFMVAVIIRMEKLNWRSKSSKAKSIGTVVAIAGAFVITFYKGPSIFSGSIDDKNSLVSSNKSNWVLGGFFLGSEAILSTAWLIMQAMIFSKFTSVLIFMFFICTLGTFWCAVIAVIMVKDSSAWKIESDMWILAAIYPAVAGAVFQSGLCAWCVSKKGPIYTATFKPLSLVLSSVVGVIFLGDPICLGSLIGGVIIVIGFYMVIWGKANEEKTIEDVIESSTAKVSLLKN